MSYQISHYINGEKIANQGAAQAIHNPATGAVIGEVFFASTEILEKAIVAAKTAFPGWSSTPPARRAQVLFKFKTLLEQHLDELATLISQEHGKTINDARGSVMRGIEVVDFACGIPYLLKGSFAENVAKNVDCYSIRQSLGICVGITPFNFPAMIPLWMFPMAIACGNTFRHRGKIINTH
jgi:malonate-semialdehyde dehydrogenase (acetylating)/methylmalonate-semialdehyde dehydrogenase